jgi:hypothetical protein
LTKKQKKVMKKKVFGAAILAAIVSVGGWNISRSVNDSALSDVALANMEALANVETPEDGEGEGDGEGDGGRMANKCCGIWIVSYSSTWSGVTVTCTTGGDYSCEDCPCPKPKPKS